MIYSHEVEMMCPVTQGVNHGAAPMVEMAAEEYQKDNHDVSAGVRHSRVPAN